jgi:hypothetical protein
MSTRHGADRLECIGPEATSSALALSGSPYTTHGRLEVAVASLLMRALIWTAIGCPHTQVRNTFTVAADPERVRVLNEQAQLQQ